MTTSRSASVSAIRPDGRVNVLYQGGTLVGVPCAASYVSRAVGDRVQLIYDSGVYTVLCKIGPDTAYTGPATNREGFMNFRTADGSGFGPQLLPTMGTLTTVPLLTALTYWNGSSNSLTSVPGPTTSIQVWIARTDDDQGRDEPVNVSLFPHAYDVLPASGFSVLPSYTQMRAGLGRGAYQVISLAADWVTDIKSGTIKGVALVPEGTLDPVDSYAQFSALTGGFTAS